MGNVSYSASTSLEDMEQPDEETITITKKDHDQLLKDSYKLAALEEFGVDNWEGYSDAMLSLTEK